MTDMQASQKTPPIIGTSWGYSPFAYLVSFLDRQILALMVAPIQADLF